MAYEMCEITGRQKSQYSLLSWKENLVVNMPIQSWHLAGHFVFIGKPGKQMSSDFLIKNHNSRKV